MRLYLVLVSALAILAPSAGALAEGVVTGTPSGEFGVGPDGIVDSSSPYYILINLSSPEAPSRAGKDADCAGASRPGGPSEAVQRLVPAAPDTLPTTLTPYVPKCVAMPVRAPCMNGACTAAYVAYNVETGRYYVEPGVGLPLAFRLGLPAGAHSTSEGYSGTTGVGVLTDCVGCPPPYDVSL